MPDTAKHNIHQEEILSKRRQFKCLLAMTQAINNNTSASELFFMYSNFLKSELQVKSMALYVQQKGQWACVSSIGNDTPAVDAIIDLLGEYKRAGEVRDIHKSTFIGFDIVVPVYHKQDAIAFTIINRFSEHLALQEEVQFISAITNIVAVAIENKRLFKQQLEQERIRQEMEIAARVQSDLIPDVLPDEQNFQLDSIYLPHYDVGGDYYDLIDLGDESYLIVLADISGKGIPAALLMSNFQAYIQTLSLSYDGLESLVELLNYSIFKNTRSDRFLTLFIAEYSQRTGIFKYVNAGHPTPFLCIEDTIHVLDKGTTIIGAVEELPEIQVGEVHLTSKALLVAYTDGLSELLNDKGDFFDEEQIVNFIKKHNQLNASEFNKALLEKINLFRGNVEFSDDIAVLSAKIIPPRINQNK